MSWKHAEKTYVTGCPSSSWKHAEKTNVTGYPSSSWEHAEMLYRMGGNATDRTRNFRTFAHIPIYSITQKQILQMETITVEILNRVILIYGALQ